MAAGTNTDYNPANTISLNGKIRHGILSSATRSESYTVGTLPVCRCLVWHFGEDSLIIRVVCSPYKDLLRTWLGHNVV
jgi:hypothetical protein